MQFGIFLPNGSNGYILSKASPTYIPTYAHLLEITKESERFGLDFVISMIKFVVSEGRPASGTPVLSPSP